MATAYEPREMMAPEINPGDEPFFEAAAEGRLLIKRCGECDRPHFYPRAICPHCFSERTEWVESSGRGTVYTFSVTRRGVATPYAIAYVTLEEGVTMLTNIVDCDLDTIAIGQAVKVSFKETDGGHSVPCFAPA